MRSDEGEHFLQTVRDDQERCALRAQAAHEGEEDVDLVRAERRGRLVEDDEAGVERERAQNLDHLLLGDGQIADLAIGVDRQIPTETTGEVVGGPVDGAAIEPPAAAIGLLVHEKDVFRHGEVRNQTQFLEDDGDARPRRVAGVAEGDRRAVPLERAASGCSTPAMILAMVDLPAPFSPISAMTSPGMISRSTPLSASMPP